MRMSSRLKTLSKAVAKDMATLIDREGWSIVKCSTFRVRINVEKWYL